MIELFLAELRRIWTEFRRYPIEAIAGISIFSFFFYGLFLSARYIAGSAFQLGSRLDSIIIGYVLWTLVAFILGNIAGELQREAQTGTLEQLFLSRYGAVKVFLIRTLAALTLQLVIILSILFIIIALTGSRLNFSPAILLPFVTVLLGAYGFAFTLGSLALLLKRIQQLLSLFQFPLLFLLTTPTETWSGLPYILAQFLPMTAGAGVLRDLMARGESLNLTHLTIAAINGAVYFAVGLGLFRLAEREAKRRGMLSGY